MPSPEGGPLRREEAEQLEACLLPALERHHLRLLAHALRSFQAIAGERQGPIPSFASLEAWLMTQPDVAADSGFASAFLPQLRSMGKQLEALAEHLGCTPLELRLEHLMAWARARADDRIGSTGCDHRNPIAPLP
jgi:hypothetical protein